MLAFRTLLLSAALAALTSLATTTSVAAQATPLGTGGGAFLAQNGETHWFAFHCVVLPDGSVAGHAAVLEPSTQSLLLMKITSAMLVGDDLAMAGPVAATVGDVPFQVGQTAFFLVDDDPAGDRFAGVGAVPPPLGSLTIQQIVGMIGPPPPAAYAPLLLGNVRIF